MPTAGSHVDDALYEEIKAAASEQRKGVSAWVKEAILEKMNRLPRVSVPQVDDTCMMKLCEEFAPAYAHYMSERVKGRDQRRYLETIVRLVALGEIGLSDDFTRASYPLAAEEAGEYRGK